MKLLSPEQVKTEKDKTESERITRVRKLNEAESKASKRLNLTLEKEKETVQRIEKSVTERNAVAAVRKTVLEVEVENLESRKRDALVPINAKIAEAQELMATAIKANKDAQLRSDRLDEREEKLGDRADSLINLADDIKSRTLKLDNREAGIKAAEAEIERSTKALSVKWLELHKEINSLAQRKEDLDRTARELSDERKTNENIRKENEQEKERLRKEDLAIKDKYRALEQAKKHIEKHG